MAKKHNPQPREKAGAPELVLKLLRRLADSPLPEVALTTTLILIRWWDNSDFSYLAEIWVPAIFFAVLGSVVFLTYRLILGRGLAPHVASLALIYAFYGYSFIEASRPAQVALKALPDSWETDFSKSIYLAILLAIVCGAVGWLAGKAVRYKTVQNVQPYKVLLFTALFVLGFQLYKTADRWLDIRQQLAYQYPSPSLEKPSSGDVERPDIYYLVFDRYGNKEVLSDNFGYDNGDIYSYLSSHGFVNREDAYANYPFTMSSIASTMAMNYFPEFEEKFGGDGNWQSAAPYRSILNNPPIAQVLEKHGYRFNQVSSWWDFTRVGIKADSNPTQAFLLSAGWGDWYLSDLQRDIINKSVLSPWLKKGITVGDSALLKYDKALNPRQNFDAQMVALKDLANRPDKSVPQFNFAHILAPHPPYIFMPDGSDSNYDPEANDNGVDETVKYKNSLQFVNNQLKSLVSEIQKASPNAIIILQSDEGPYPKQFRGPMSPEHYYDPLELPLPALKQKVGMLASYYLPGLDREKVKTIDSSVNIFRFVLNNYLGYNLPILPDCHISTGNKFTIYSYQQLPGGLTGNPVPEGCKAYDPAED